MSSITRKPVFVPLGLVLVLLALFALVKFAPAPEASSNQAIVPVVAEQIPSPVGTYDPSIITPPPLTTPPTAPPLPRPPATIALTPNATASATTFPTSSVGITPTGAATAAPGEKVMQASANIAWGAESEEGLTIWIGTYSDSPAPNLSNAKALVKWSDRLRLRDMAFSPDGESLAILTEEFVDSEGSWPNWLWVVNLSTGATQPVPDYPNSTIYEYKFYRPAQRILGWLDNDSFAVQQVNEWAIVRANKNGTAYSRVGFPPSDTWTFEATLSPDRSEFFANVSDMGETIEGGFWRFNTDGTNPRQLVNWDKTRSLVYPSWSPSGSYIGYLSPRSIIIDGTKYDDYNRMGLWLLDLKDNKLQAVSDSDQVDVWDVSPAWSSDGAEIAFLRADAPVPTDGTVVWSMPEAISTNILASSVTSDQLTPRKVTNFTGVRNSTIRWTPGNNFILSSTAGATNNKRGIVAITSNGTATLLVSSTATEEMVQPALAAPVLPGLPRTGESTPASP